MEPQLSSIPSVSLGWAANVPCAENAPNNENQRQKEKKAKEVLDWKRKDEVTGLDVLNK